MTVKAPEIIEKNGIKFIRKVCPECGKVFDCFENLEHPTCRDFQCVYRYNHPELKRK